MVTTTMATEEGTECGSIYVIKNGRDKNGKQKFHGKDCGAYGTLNPTVKYLLRVM